MKHHPSAPVLLITERNGRAVTLPPLAVPEASVMQGHHEIVPLLIGCGFGGGAWCVHALEDAEAVVAHRDLLRSFASRLVVGQL